MSHSPSGEPDKSTLGRLSQDKLGVDVPFGADARDYLDQRVPHPDANGGNGHDSNPSEPATWTRFVNWHPGAGYIQFLADCENPAIMEPNDRYANAVKSHPCLHRWALVLDSLLITLVVAAVLALIGFAAYRVLWPS